MQPESKFIAALVSVAKIWQQPKCPWRDDWIKKRWYIHAMEYYSAITNEILPFATTWVDRPRWYYAKWIKSGRERQIPYDFTYM